MLQKNYYSAADAATATQPSFSVKGLRFEDLFLDGQDEHAAEVAASFSDAMSEVNRICGFSAS